MNYEFECSVHGRYEERQSMGAEHSSSCPICGREGKRIYSLAGFYHDNPKPLYFKDGSYEEK